LILTLFISIFSGALGGFVAGTEFFQPPHSLFRDDDHFTEMKEKYPKSYLKDTDEDYEKAKVSFD